MNFERRMERDKRDFERRMDDSRKKFDLELFKISQDINKKSEGFNRKVTFWLILFAVLELLGTLLSLAFPNGLGG